MSRRSSISVVWLLACIIVQAAHAQEQGLRVERGPQLHIGVVEKAIHIPRAFRRCFLRHYLACILRFGSSMP